MKSILLIEDNPEICGNIKELLELSGYHVTAAVTGRAGVNSALKTLPDLILCDVMLPELDGFGVFIELNKNPYTAGIPFIFLTAQAELASKKYGMHLGAEDYITKPFDPDFLLTTINKRIEKHHKVKEEKEWQTHRYIKELEDMLHITSHKIRAPLCTCLGLINMLENEEDIEAEDLKKIFTYMKLSIADLDSFTHELTSFLSQSMQRKLDNLEA